ncbi:MAG: COX15/CtaA family protein [Halobacteriovoraceae bacterium]|nr:COX15/CtaA family protein [Halobacteriovoraceae bacterium]
MVMIGGITRLTDSGLSIVDWKPIMGILPPLNQQEWLVAFTKYQAYPEFKIVNSQMDLAGFKAIFFWEYFHRLFGRLIGLVFFLPYVYFYFKKALSAKLNKKLLVLFFLGGLQGLMGWYMVMSGLVSNPDVSHYRLAAHLMLAFIIIAYAFWIILGLKYPGHNFNSHAAMKKSLVIFALIITMQILYGAFVAGLDAGLTHNTFPKMGRSWVPFDVSILLSTLALFENNVVVQFVHRSFGWLLLFMTIIMFYQQRNLANAIQKKSIQMMLVFLIIQFLLGVTTLLMYVPLLIASIHQLGACILIILVVRSLFFTFMQEE